jgi:outer membrane protein assembly factor BamB
MTRPVLPYRPANPWRGIRIRFVWRLLLGLVCFAGPLRAGDWPQILGPHRNGLADGERLAAKWPNAGPTPVWQRTVGEGLAGLAVRKNNAVLFHRLGDELVAECLDTATGKPRWKLSFPTRYVSTISPDNGPRCVPLIDQDRVYLIGPAGELQCAEMSTGKKLWYRDVFDEFDAPEGYFGAGSSPIVADGKLLLNVGGSSGAGIVALALDDGKTIWKATDDAASYSSPTAATLDGVRHVVFVTRLNVISLDPINGAVHFSFPFGSRGPTVNAANPLILGNHLFVSASYGVGARWARFSEDSVNIEWESDKVMSSQYTTCMHHDGYLYGIDGRQDVGVARLRCCDPLTGKIAWTREGFGTGNLILADGKLLIMKTDGELVLAEPRPKEFKPLASAKLFETTVQALPALSDGRLFVRDTKTLKCLLVGEIVDR